MKEINISAVLTAKRKEKAITQEELASYIGVSKASVSKWETGQSYPDITFLPQLASYFDITIDELIDYHPQMTKENIKKLYHRLAEDFTKNGADEVMAECEELIRKYYSCHPLLLQMAILFLNHVEFFPEKTELLLDRSIALCKRIRTESEDLSLVEMAAYIQSMSFLGLGRPEEVPLLLENIKKPMLYEELLLSGAYSALGKHHEADEIAQIRLFQYVLGTVQDSMFLMQLTMNDVPRFDEILSRAKAVCQAYNLLQLHPNTMFTFCFTAAQGYVMQNRPDKAVEMLSLFINNCNDPFILHGDDFFTKIEPWLADLDLGVEPPRNAKNIKQSLLVAIQSPIFEPLFDNPEYQNIVNLLKMKLEEDSNG